MLNLLRMGLVLFITMAPHLAGATIVAAADGTAAGITAALSTLDGPGLVVIPPGEWGWGAADEVVVEHDGVTLLGAGPETTLLYREYGQDKVAFFRASGVRDLRITGIRFKGVPHADTKVIEYGVVLTAVDGFRVDHCLFSHLGFAGVRSEESSTGVVDHCRFSKNFRREYGSLGYGVVVYGDNTHHGTPLGSPEATFIEDNEMSLCFHAVAANKGARYVFRHNQVSQNTMGHAVDAHGEQYSAPGSVGTEWVEIYDNRFASPNRANSDSSRKYTVRLRGGQGVIYDNHFADIREGIRIDETTPQSTGPVWIWGNELLRDPDPNGRAPYCVETETPGDVLCVRKLEGEDVKPPADGMPVFHEVAPEGYQPHPYPHPRVTALGVEAGHDRVVLLPGDGRPATVSLVAKLDLPQGHTASSARWYTVEQGTLTEQTSTTIELTRGEYLLLIEVTRDDGLMGYDALLFSVVAGFQPVPSSDSWTSRWFDPVFGGATVQWLMTPTVELMDGYAALTGATVVTEHGDNAIIVRTNNEGFFDARHGDHYQADTRIPYVAGAAYPVKIQFDTLARTYSVWVNGTPLATDYPFRTLAEPVTQLTVWHSVGGLTVTDFSLEQ